MVIIIMTTPPSHRYLQCVEPVPDAIVPPQQYPAVLVAGEGYGEVALPRQEGHLLNLGQTQLNTAGVEEHIQYLAGSHLYLTALKFTSTGGFFCPISHQNLGYWTVSHLQAIRYKLGLPNVRHSLRLVTIYRHSL